MWVKVIIVSTCDVQINNPLLYTVEKFTLMNCVSLSTVASSLPSLLVSEDNLLRTKYPCPLNNGGPVGSSKTDHNFLYLSKLNIISLLYYKQYILVFLSYNLKY